VTTVLEFGPMLVRDSIRTSWRIGRRAVVAPAGLVRDAAERPLSALHAITSAGAAQGVDRQVWAAAGRAVIEVRGLDDGGDDRSAWARSVEKAVASVPGIDSARLDAVTSRIAVSYDRNRHTIADLVAALTAAEEQAHGDRAAASDGSAPARAEDVTDALPDTWPEAVFPRELPQARVNRLALAADVLALAGSVGTRLAGRPPMLPSSVAGLVALMEEQPRLRRWLEGRLGPPGAELALALGNALVHGLTGNLPALLLDGARRTHRMRAGLARLAAHEERKHELHGMFRPPPVTTVGTDERPVPLPPGPVERLQQRMATASLGAGAALLAGTRNPDLVGRALAVGTPRPAQAARQGFVDMLVIGLARRDVLVRTPGALPRLDRVTSVVVESAVLHDDRPLIVDARADAGAWTAARVWRAAQRLLDAARAGGAPASETRALVEPVTGADGAGQRGGDRLTPLLLTDHGAIVGEVLVGRELDPLTDAVLSAVREAGLRLILTEDFAAPELGSRTDEVLRDGRGDALWLRHEVRRLQADGQVVAVVGTDQEALEAADLAIGLVPRRGPVPWAADVLCGPGLREVPRLIAAVPAARAISEQGVRVSIGASFLGSLLLAVGRPGTGRRAQLPVNVGAAGTFISGIRAARAVARRPEPVPVLHTPWHALEPREVLIRVADPGPAVAGDDGPGQMSVLTRGLHLVGDLAANVRAELDDPLTPVLATGAAASAVIGSPTDAFLVGGVLTGSAVISGIQRMRAERALRELLMDQRLPARVVDAEGDDRSGGFARPPRIVPATHLQPGHVIDLQAGDVVPADARLLELQELEIDEATLTGESTPVGKELPATPGAELPDRTGMVYEGTTVVAGAGRAVVVAVGAATEAGRALALAGHAAAPAGMQHRLEELTSRGLPITLLGGATVTGLALLRGASLRSAIAGGVSVAVAAVPEGLPLMATVAQLGAARRLSRRGVLVRASRTVEALGRVDTICFDKTGTLTEGRLRLVRAAGLEGEWPPDAPEVRRLIREAAYAGPAPRGSGPLPHATDQAVLDTARAVLGTELGQSWEELVEIPFHSDRGFSAVVGRTPNKVRLVVKGAPEVLLPRCSHVRDDDGKRALDRVGQDRATAAVHSLAVQGLRVLAVARRNVGDAAGNPPVAEDVAELGDLTLLGFIGLADAPRAQAAGTVTALQAVGIAPVMITGDHPVTAAAIADRLGIPSDELVTGPDLVALDEPARIARVGDASVFARVSPEQKLQIIQALQQGGRVVAMAGDGANDAAAIRMADVGIGMAAKGSTSARSAADLVFTEPDISLVLDSLVEGRAMWRRVRDAVAVLVGGNVGEVLFTLLGTALAGHAPISTRQFLVVNMFTDLLPSMALALAPTPADPEERTSLLEAGPPSLGGPLLRDIGFRGAMTSLGALTAWQLGRIGGTRRRSGTIALASLVGAELGQTLLVGGRDPLVLATGLGSAAMLAAIIQTPGVSQFFDCTPLDPFAWTVVLGCSAGATLASMAVPRLVPGLRRATTATRAGGG
jgi:cation-transporting ATPase I